MRRPVRVHAGNVPRVVQDKRDMHLRIRKITSMSPEVLLILVKLLSMIPGNNNHGIIQQSVRLQFIHHLSHERIHIIGTITVQIKERFRVQIIIQSQIIGIIPRGLKFFTIRSRNIYCMQQIIKYKRKERFIHIFSLIQIIQKIFRDPVIPIKRCCSRSFLANIFHVPKDDTIKRRINKRCTGERLYIIPIFQ